MQERSLMLAKLLKHASDISATHLPLGGSIIAYKLLLNLYISRLSGEAPTVKALFASIPYSDMGIRYHLRKLLDEGWIQLKPSPIDKRTKICVPTDKFDQAWALVNKQINEELGEDLGSNLIETFVCKSCSQRG